MPNKHSYHPYNQQSTNSGSSGQHHHHNQHQHSRNHHPQHHHHHHNQNQEYRNNQRGNRDENYSTNNNNTRGGYSEPSNSNQFYNNYNSNNSRLSSSSSGGRYYEQLGNNNNQNNQQYQQSYSNNSNNNNRGGNQNRQVRFSSSSNSSSSTRIERNSNAVMRQPEHHDDFCDVCRKFEQKGMMKCISCGKYRHVHCDLAKRTPKSKEKPQSKYIKFMCETCFDIKVEIERDDFRIFGINKITVKSIEHNLDEMDDCETSSVVCPLCNQLVAGHSREIFNNHLRFKFKDVLLEKHLLTGTIPIPIISRKEHINHSFSSNDFNTLSNSFFVLGFKKDDLELYMKENCAIEKDDISNFTQIDKDSLCFISCKSVRGAFILACKLRCAVIKTAHPMIYFIKSTRSIKIFQKISSSQEFNFYNNDGKSIKNMEITSTVPSQVRNEAIVHFASEDDCIKWMWTCHKSAQKALPRIEFYDDRNDGALKVCHIRNLPTKGITLSDLWKDIKTNFKQRLGLVGGPSKLKYFVSDWSYDSSHHTFRVEFHHSKFCEIFKLLLDGIELHEVKLSIVIPNK